MNDELIKLLIELKSDISVLKNEVDRTNERLSYIPRDLMSRFDDVVEDITAIELVLHRSNVGFFAQNKILSAILVTAYMALVAWVMVSISVDFDKVSNPIAAKLDTLTQKKLDNLILK